MVSQQSRKRSSSLSNLAQIDPNPNPNAIIIDYLDRIENRLNAISFELQTVRDDLQLIRQQFSQH